MDMYTSEKLHCGIVEGRNIVKSIAIGKWGPEDADNLTFTILKQAKSFGNKPWAYVADPTKLHPILSKETAAAFTNLHVECEKAGCKAIAFLDGNTAAMKLQSQKHQNESNTNNLRVLHFKTEEEAFDWLKDMGI